MQPLGNKILVRDIQEDINITVDSKFDITIADKGKTAGGIFIPAAQQTVYRKVKVEAISETSNIPLSVGDVCLCNKGGVEIEKGLWLINENLLDAVV